MSILCSLRGTVLAPGDRRILRHLVIQVSPLGRGRYSPVDGKSYLVALGKKGRPNRILEAQEMGRQAESVGTPGVPVSSGCCNWRL